MLVWKTDWDKTGNHARAGAADLARLVHNYRDIAARLNRLYNLNIQLEFVEELGYSGYPFADVLNRIERNLAEIFVLPIDAYEGSKTVYYSCGRWVCGSKRKLRRIELGYIPTTWEPLGRAPMYTDVNRWELNGEALDQWLDRASGITLECGVAFCGTPFTRQLYGDFYGLGAPGTQRNAALVIYSGTAFCGEPYTRQQFGDWRG